MSKFLAILICCGAPLVVQAQCGPDGCLLPPAPGIHLGAGVSIQPRPRRVPPVHSPAVPAPIQSHGQWVQINNPQDTPCVKVISRQSSSFGFMNGVLLPDEVPGKSYVATVAHGVMEAQQIEVVALSGTYAANIVRESARYDALILEVDADLSQPAVGGFADDSTEGWFVGYRESASPVLWLKTGRRIATQDLFYRFSFASHGGMSGGGVYSADRQLIGLVSNGEEGQQYTDIVPAQVIRRLFQELTAPIPPEQPDSPAEKTTSPPPSPPPALDAPPAAAGEGGFFSGVWQSTREFVVRQGVGWGATALFGPVAGAIALGVWQRWRGKSTADQRTDNRNRWTGGGSPKPPITSRPEHRCDANAAVDRVVEAIQQIPRPSEKPVCDGPSDIDRLIQAMREEGRPWDQKPHSDCEASRNDQRIFDSLEQIMRRLEQQATTKAAAGEHPQYRSSQPEGLNGGKSPDGTTFPDSRTPAQAVPQRDTEELSQIVQLSRLDGHDPLLDAAFGLFVQDETDSLLGDMKTSPETRQTIENLLRRVRDRVDRAAPLSIQQSV